MNSLPGAIFSIVTVISVFITTFVIGELSIRTFRPQQYMYPRFVYSPEYGHLPPKNCKMVHACPGKWKFVYTINEYQYRGRALPISNSYAKKNIIVLGDSNSFGYGADDGEEYAAIMYERLKDDFNVVNLSVGGWGLTQEIRRYYEFGQLYLPRIVILQFSPNDPIDNFHNRVTKTENRRFVFRNSNNTSNFVKRYLSRSIIQKSQIYNLFRHSIALWIREKIKEREKSIYLKENVRTRIPPEEAFYNDLLELFANDLDRKGVKLVIIAKDDLLNQSPYIKEKIAEMVSKGNGRILYYDITPWLANIVDYNSPEGHLLGKMAHHILGMKLSEVVNEIDVR